MSVAGSGTVSVWMFLVSCEFPSVIQAQRQTRRLGRSNNTYSRDSISLLAIRFTAPNTRSTLTTGMRR
jgi:hypothetical protein